MDKNILLLTIYLILFLVLFIINLYQSEKEFKRKKMEMLLAENSLKYIRETAEAMALLLEEEMRTPPLIKIVDKTPHRVPEDPII